MGDLVVKHNAFAEASYNLDLVASRLFLLAIVEARSQTDDIQEILHKPIKIPASSYMRHFDVKKSAAYISLKKAVNDLFYAEFRYSMLDKKGDLVEYKSRFVQKIGYSENAGYVELVFSNDVLPLIMGLQSRFTAYEINQISRLQSKYALRLYELVISKKNFGRVLNISFADLRKKLGILPNEFERMCDFKTRVLKVSIKEINQYTDINVTYEQLKEGRNIVGFIFSYDHKDGVVIDEIIEKYDENKILIPYNASELCFADCVVKLLKKDKKRYKEMYSDDEIFAIIKRANEYADELHDKGKKVAFAAIYKKAFEENWGQEILIKKQKDLDKQKAEQDKLAKKEQARLAKIQKQQEEERAKKEKAKREEQRKNEMIARFESLPLDEQEQVLDAVCKENRAVEMFSYSKKRADGVKVYTEPMFSGYFYKYVGME